MRASKGFTLVELLTALAIMGVGMALALPMITNLIEGSRLTSTANSVVESLAVARSEAIRQRAVMELVPIDGDWRDGWLVRNADGVEVARFDAVPDSLTLSTSEDVESIQFQPNGNRTLGATQVSLTMCGSSGKGRRIDIGVAGTTSIDKIEDGCGE